MPEPAENSSRPWPFWLRGLALALCLAPLVALAALLWQNAVNVPYWDEWDDAIAGVFVKWHDGTLRLGDLWAQHNESRLVLPRVIFLVLGGFGKWNLSAEVGFTFLLLALAAVMIFRLGKGLRSAQPAAGWAAFFIACLLLFSPAQYQALLWGMELILYLPLVFILAALLMLRASVPTPVKIGFAALMAAASTCSFSNGLLAWLVLFPAIFLRDGWAGLKAHSRAALLWLLAFLANVALYFQNYQFPPSPGLGTVLREHPWQAAQYVLAFLGAPLANQNGAHQAVIATLIGGAALVLFIISAVTVFRRREAALVSVAVPWLTLGGYGILSAVLAATGRAAFGVEQALSPRYGIFGICLFVALVYLVPMLVFGRKLENASGNLCKFVAALGVAVLLLHASAWSAAVVNLKYFSATLRQARACLRFINVLPLQPATRATLCPDDAKVRRMANLLADAGVLDYPLLSSARLADFPQIAAGDAAPRGAVEVGEISGGNVFLSGWALAPARRDAADCVVFSREADGRAPEIFAVMDRRFARFDLVQKLGGREYLLSGWQKTVPLADLPKGRLALRAWSFDAETGAMAPLGGGVQLDNP
jgi:hypothetical protein